MTVVAGGLYAALQSAAAAVTTIGFGSTVASGGAVTTYAILQSAAAVVAGPVGLVAAVGVTVGAIGVAKLIHKHKHKHHQDEVPKSSTNGESDQVCLDGVAHPTN